MSTRFKPGDKVRRKSTSSSGKMKVGTEWIVKTVSTNGSSIGVINDPSTTGVPNPWDSFRFVLVESVDNKKETKMTKHVVILETEKDSHSIAQALKEAGIEAKVSTVYSQSKIGDFDQTLWTFSVENSDWVVKSL